jgi:hypothetical protein
MWLPLLAHASRRRAGICPSSRSQAGLARPRAAGDMSQNSNFFTLSGEDVAVQS